ncbi:hypothetical protein FACS189418_7650 [Clostridia bacterium]|nr:hypothetical protein FACS189418_7650 [Clostridia bacterium]
MERRVAAILAAPLLANRLCLSILQSTEAIMIPNCLQLFGLNDAEALSMYGTLTGMALSFILFPSTISNSLSVMLLPAMAEAKSAKKQDSINYTASKTISFSLATGILFIGVFLEFGKDLGRVFFHSDLAGTFIQILSWICPFLYLSTTVGSILNGLGKTNLTFFHHLISLSLRIFFIVFGTPKIGILACLWGMLASELLLTFLHIHTLRKHTQISFSALKSLLIPSLFLILSTMLYREIFSFAKQLLSLPPALWLTLGCASLCLSYLSLFWIFRKKL